MWAHELGPTSKSACQLKQCVAFVWSNLTMKLSNSELTTNIVVIFTYFVFLDRQLHSQLQYTFTLNLLAIFHSFLDNISLCQLNNWLNICVFSLSECIFERFCWKIHTAINTHNRHRNSLHSICVSIVWKRRRVHAQGECDKDKHRKGKEKKKKPTFYLYTYK